jgi:hypothetical protein
MDELSVTFKSVPIPTGAAQVGTVRYDLEDPYRKDLQFPEGRLIPIQIYFPMKKGPHTARPKTFEERAHLGPFHPLHADVYAIRSDLSHLEGSHHPVIFLNHASCVAMTDYAFFAEDLASHGYVVISIQHDLKVDGDSPPFWESRSCSRNAKVIDNLLYVFEWLKEHQHSLFHGKIDLNRIGFIGHSLGANSLLFWVNRSLDMLEKDPRHSLLYRQDTKSVRECLILMEATRFAFPSNSKFPIFFLFAEDRESYQTKTDGLDLMLKAGHKVRYYKGSTHTSFMDHGYVNPPLPKELNEPYFNGSSEERVTFFNAIREEIRHFLASHLGSSHP